MSRSRRHPSWRGGVVVRGAGRAHRHGNMGRRRKMAELGTTGARGRRRTVTGRCRDGDGTTKWSYLGPGFT
jgi:hypothetical protein